MWNVAMAAVFLTQGLKDKELSQYTSRFQAQGDDFTLFMSTGSSKS